MEINIAEPFMDLFDDNCKATRFVCLSGRSTGKTETFARKVFAQCDRYKQSFIVVRDKSMYLKSNIWRTMKRIAKEIGVYDEYIWHTSMPLTIKHKSGKYSIDLYGIEDDAEKLKGYEGEGKQLCGIWFEEFGLISSPQSIADVENTVARSMATYACWLYSGNPKPEANSWERIWVNKIRSIPSYRVFDVTFADIWEMLSEQNKNNIRLAYLTDREQFNYSYLGKPKTNDGLVYKSYIPDRNDITVKTPLDDMIIAWCIGIDVAVDRDKTAAVLMLKLANGRLVTRAIKTHDPKQTKHILTVNQQAEFIFRWYEQIKKGIEVGGQMQDISRLPHSLVVDNSDFGMRDELTNKGVNCVKIGKKDVLADIERGKTLFNYNRMCIVRDRCQPLVEELESIVWKKVAKSINIKTEDYGTVTKQQYVSGEDDVENAWRYAHSFLTSGNYQGYVLPSLTGYEEIREVKILGLDNKGALRRV